MAAQSKSQHDRVIKVSVYRFNPETDDKPYMQDFDINMADFHGVMVINALTYIKTHIDNSISIRHSCHEGVCGSDGVNINGTNGLACVTSLVDLPDHIVVRPLPGLPVIRDLVVDMSIFYEQYRRAKPYLINNEVEPAKERLQSPEERKEIDGLYECILCACCSTSCPSFWWNPDKFMGPAALLWAARFVKDSRDTAKRQRLSALTDPFSLYRCRGIMNCVSVCPKHLNPTKAIAQLRSEIIQQAS